MILMVSHHFLSIFLATGKQETPLLSLIYLLMVFFSVLPIPQAIIKVLFALPGGMCRACKIEIQETHVWSQQEELRQMGTEDSYINDKNITYLP